MAVATLDDLPQDLGGIGEPVPRPVLEQINRATDSGLDCRGEAGFRRGDAVASVTRTISLSASVFRLGLNALSTVHGNPMLDIEGPRPSRHLPEVTFQCRG